METAVLLLVAFAVILLGAELFTNSIEWVGRKLDLAEGAVGSVLAAVGTALPETMIPLVAILAGGAAASHEVGIGAILGAPFMLATLAMFVTGCAVLASRTRRRTGERLDVEPVVVGKDVRYFLLTYGLAIAVAFTPLEWTWARPAAAIVLFVLYGIYVRAHFAAESQTGHGGDLAPLRFHRLDRGAHRADPVIPRLRVVSFQVVFALGLIIGGAIIFVDAVTTIADDPRAERHAAGPGHRAHRDRVAREAQQHPLGPPGQGHAGHRQHLRRDGLPGLLPDGRRAAVRAGQLVDRP